MSSYESSLLSRFARVSSSRDVDARHAAVKRDNTPTSRSAPQTKPRPTSGRVMGSRQAPIAGSSSKRIMRPTSAKPLRSTAPSTSSGLHDVPREKANQIPSVKSLSQISRVAGVTKQPTTSNGVLVPSQPSSKVATTTNNFMATEDEPTTAERAVMREEVASFIRTTVSKQRPDEGPRIREYKGVNAHRLPAAKPQTKDANKSALVVVKAEEERPKPIEKKQASTKPSSLAVATTSSSKSVARGANKFGTTLTEEEEAALSGAHGCGKRNVGEYVYHFPSCGHYCCRRCHTPLFSAKAKASVGGGFAAFSKHFAHSMKSEVIIGDECNTAASKTNMALYLMQVSDNPAVIKMNCVRCEGFVGILTQDRETDTGDYLKVNSLSILYRQEAAPDAFLQSEQCMNQDEMLDGEEDEDFIDEVGNRKTAMERHDQMKRIDNWGAGSRDVHDRRRQKATSGDAYYRGAVPRGQLLTAKRADSYSESDYSGDDGSEEEEDCFS